MHDTRQVRVQYFAQLQDAAGRADESISPDSIEGHTAQDWYDHLSQRYGFHLDRSIVRAALNGRYARWSDPVKAGDELAFIPPVAGG